MGTNTTIGLDLAKLVFSACSMDGTGRVLERRDLRRVGVSPWLGQAYGASAWPNATGTLPPRHGRTGAACGYSS